MQPQERTLRQARALESLMSRRLGLRRGPLALRARRARGKLPAAIKRDLVQVFEAAHLVAHPRIAPQLDHGGVAAAHGRAKAYLEGPVLREVSKTRMIRLLSEIMVKMILVALALVFGVIWIQGG